MLITIYDDILSKQEAEWYGGFSLDSLNSLLNEMTEDDNVIDLEIHSNGGSVTEGWAIIDKIRATGKEIHSNAYGLVASMALSIFLAGSSRKAPKNATFLAHNPWIMSVGGTADDLQKAERELRESQEQLLDWYCERTGCEREKMSALMAEDRIITAQEALEYGFIHEISDPVSASVSKRYQIGFKVPQVSEKPLKENMDKKKTLADVVKDCVSALGAFIKETPKDYVLTSADGQSLTIEKPEGESPAVGDVASPDGTFVMEDGSTIVIADGVISEIISATTEDDEKKDDEKKDDEKAELTAENEALKAKVAELEAKIAELESEKAEQDKAVEDANKAKASVEKQLHELRSSYKPAQRANNLKGTAAPAASARERLAELRESLKK